MPRDRSRPASPAFGKLRPPDPRRGAFPRPGQGQVPGLFGRNAPNTEVYPFALGTLKRRSHETPAPRSRHLPKFQSPGAPVMDVVFTSATRRRPRTARPGPAGRSPATVASADPAEAAGNRCGNGAGRRPACALLRGAIAVLSSFLEISRRQIQLPSRFDFRGGAQSLAAVMEWPSRKVLVWRISNALGAAVCVGEPNEAIRRFGRRPVPPQTGKIRQK